MIIQVRSSVIAVIMTLIGWTSHQKEQCINSASVAQAAKRLKCPPLINASEVLHDPLAFQKEIEPGQHHHRDVRKSDFSRSCFLRCMLAAMCWTLIVENRDHIHTLFWNTFFTVPKSNGLLRVITDCRRLSAHSRKPPPTGLCGISEVLQKAADLGCTRHLQCDITSWFHLLRLPDKIGPRYFGYKIKDVYDGIIDTFGIGVGQWDSAGRYMWLRPSALYWLWISHLKRTHLALIISHYRAGHVFHRLLRCLTLVAMSLDS